MKAINITLGAFLAPLLSVAMEQPPHLKPAAPTATPRRIIIRQKPKPNAKNQPHKKNNPVPKKAAAQKHTVLDINLDLLHQFLEAVIHNDRAHLHTRSTATYHTVINSANNAYNDAYEIAQLQKRYKMSEDQIRRLLKRAIQNAYQEIEALRTGPVHEEKA